VAPPAPASEALPWLEPDQSGSGAASAEPPTRRGARRGRPWSLRRRVLVLLAALMVVGLGVADFVTYRTLHNYLLNREDSQLDALAHGAARELITGTAGPGFGSRYGSSIQPFIEARGSDGSVAGSVPASEGGVALAPPALPARLPAVPAPVDGDAVEGALYMTVSSSKAGQPPYRVRLSGLGEGPLEVQGETLVVATPLTEVQATLRALFWTEFGVSGGALLLALLAGAWLVRLSLRPLERMADTAGEIAAGALDRRVPTDGSRTEVGRLGAALNGMLARIEGAFSEKEASEARLRRFVADASHELRTPLTSIRGYAELFRRGADRRPEDLAKVMRRIEDEASRMGLLVDDLLLLARLDQGRPLSRRPVDVSVLAAEAVDAARAVEPDREMTMEVDPGLWVQADRDRLRQVLDNLLGNVRMHTPPGAPATLRARSGEDSVLIEVQDSGPGIAPEAARRVFERFYRADPARTHASGGAGLGLSIVESIVAAHGGRVEVGNAAGGGACFRIYLPPLEPGAGPLDEPPPADSQPSPSFSQA
jgi:two-component system OmpR family sensor kinase